MNGQTAVIAGGTGLVGNHLVQQLTKDTSFEKIIVLTRRPMATGDPKLVNKVVNFDRMSELEAAFEKADVIFAAVGTTQKKVQGDEAAYRKVDYDIPVNIARIGLQKGVKTFVLVSVVGADVNSSSFYLKLKGEVENAITSMGYHSVYILRPSMLLGKRNEFRLGESVGKAVMQSASVLFFGPMRKYYPVKAREVAQAMVGAGKQSRPGTHFLYYDEMMELKKQSVTA